MVATYNFGSVYILQLIPFARVCSHIDDFNNRSKFLTSKLLKQGYRYHKLHKAFFKFYYQHSELINTMFAKRPFCNKAYHNLYFMAI